MKGIRLIFQSFFIIANIEQQQEECKNGFQIEIESFAQIQAKIQHHFVDLRYLHQCRAIQLRNFYILKPQFEEIASSSKKPQDKEFFEVQLVNNEVKQPDFRLILEVAYKNDPVRALSMIPPKVVMVQDVRRCYNYKIGAIGDMEIREAYNKFYENGVFKEEFQIVERKGLIHALDFPTVFKMEWVRIILRKIHDGCIWLEDGPIKLSKIIIHRLIGYPTLE